MKNEKEYVKRILWLSRHEPEQKQIKELQDIFGYIEIVQIKTTVENADEVIKYMEEHGCSEVVAVLPLNIIAQLTAKGIKPIRAVMEREVLPNGDVKFKHQHFERILKVEVVSVPLISEVKQ